MPSQHFVKQHLIEKYGLSVEDVEELVESAKNSVHKGVNSLQTHIKNKHFDKIVFVSQTLKGNFMNMGLDDAASLIQHLQTAAKKKHFQEVNADYDLLIEKISHLL